MTSSIQINRQKAVKSGSQLWLDPCKRDNHLLLLGTQDQDFTFFKTLLEQIDHQFTRVIYMATLSDAAEYLQKHRPKCCVLNSNLEDGTAKDLLTLLNKENGMPEFPVLISLNSGEQRSAVEYMELGALDYFIKDDINGSLLLASMNNALSNYSIRNQLHFLSHFDSLTGLLNRSLFLDRLEQAVGEAKRYGRSLQVCSLDIDYFKHINEKYGQRVGDSVLAVIAGRIKEVLRETDSVGRLGGDEFVILLPEASGEDGKIVASKVIKAVSEPIEIGEIIIQSSISAGIASFPDTADDHQELLEQAGTALFKSKQTGRSKIYNLSKSHSNVWKRKIMLSKALPEALQKRELGIVYQPVFSSEQIMPISVEALIRWNYQGDSIDPREILHIAEQCNMLAEFHHWMFREALGQLKIWQQNNKNLSMAFNLPANFIQNDYLLESLYDAIDWHGIASKTVILEISETNLMQQPLLVKSVIKNAAEKGLQIAVDNFGVGTSSLEFLADFPCHFLKIDKSFFHSFKQQESKSRMIDAITAMGNRLGLKVVATGIENQACKAIADRAGCQINQGYLYGRPVSAEKNLELFLRRSRDFCGQVAPVHEYICH